MGLAPRALSSRAFGRAAAYFRHQPRKGKLAWLGAASLLLVSALGIVIVSAPGTVTPLPLELGHGDFARVLAFSPDGRTLASAGSREGVVTLWDGATREEWACLRGHQGLVHAAAFAPDGRGLATARQAHTVRLRAGAAAA